MVKMRPGFILLTAVLMGLDLPVARPEKAIAADVKAYAKASTTTDPQAELDALRKFVKGYPKSVWAGEANLDILGVLAKNFPSRTNEVDAQIKLLMQSKTGMQLENYDDLVAVKLSEGDTYLDRAEQFAKDSLSRFNEAGYIAEMKNDYVHAKESPPADKELHEYYTIMHAHFEGTLGAIYVRQGKTAEGEQLLKDSYRENPTNSEVARQIGEVELKAGRQDAAFDYFVQARLEGDINAEHEELLESLYKQAHGDSLSGFDAFLDERYQKLYPEPFHAAAYQAPPSRSNREVLVELLTGSGCGSCPSADVAVDEMIERYARKDVAVLVYHEHRPHPDPMTNPSSNRRFDYYDAQGVPTIIIDGAPDGNGGGIRSEFQKVYDRVNPTVEKELQAPAEAAIAVSVARDRNVVQVHALADQIKSTSPDLRMQIALVELRERFSGENGIRFHPMVVRDLANLNDDGFAVHPGEPVTADYAFDVAKISADLKNYIEDYEENNERFGKFKFVELKNTIDPADLAVVVFVQDMKTKQILQSSFTRVNANQDLSGGR